MVRFSFMTQTAIVFLWRSTPMKFIAGLLVWGNGGMGKTSQVFPRFKGSANRRVDLHLPLIVSIPGSRRRDIERLAMPEAGTQTSSDPQDQADQTGAK